MAGSRIVVKTRIPQYSRAVRAALEKAVSDTALEIEGRAKMLAPVDTGFLKSSIFSKQIAPYRWAIGPAASYGIWQELGTHRMAAHPFLLPALRASESGFYARIAAAAGGVK
jgi:HK97 gp10 family phage protein